MPGLGRRGVMRASSGAACLVAGLVLAVLARAKHTSRTGAVAPQELVTSFKVADNGFGRLSPELFSSTRAEHVQQVAEEASQDESWREKDERELTRESRRAEVHDERWISKESSRARTLARDPQIVTHIRADSRKHRHDRSSAWEAMKIWMTSPTGSREDKKIASHHAAMTSSLPAEPSIVRKIETDADHSRATPVVSSTLPPEPRSIKKSSSSVSLPVEPRVVRTTETDVDSWGMNAPSVEAKANHPAATSRARRGVAIANNGRYKDPVYRKHFSRDTVQRSSRTSLPSEPRVVGEIQRQGELADEEGGSNQPFNGGEALTDDGHYTDPVDSTVMVDHVTSTAGGIASAAKADASRGAGGQMQVEAEVLQKRAVLTAKAQQEYAREEGEGKHWFSKTTTGDSAAGPTPQA